MGSFKLPRVATTKKRRFVEEVTVKTRRLSPIQKPIVSRGALPLGEASSTTRPGYRRMNLSSPARGFALSLIRWTRPARTK